MNELSRLNPSTAKVTVARPMGRAMSNGGAREVEAVAPVVLDNDAALGFLREHSRQQATGQRENRLNQDDRTPNRPDLDTPQKRAGFHRDSQMQAAYGDPRVVDQPSLDTSAHVGFVTHLMGQNDGEVVAVSPTAQKQMLLDRYSQSSEAYRRAGAEPLYFGESSQVVRVAV
ncbi:hypothetical protein [Denitrobaculum tricleocarpae]|uniref:Uncharacterized protein n=1 Tax=Denitrobaculum tricleocarpae TaxID=2591009 RepID=A0A545U1M6_9PROT|nr:hypothetical protein [Denitrobaculum tricleocarpae]TQV83380.1 hypothetical protein FKG95_01915 [Denitrobaculum tricleocarpae]